MHTGGLSDILWNIWSWPSGQLKTLSVFALLRAVHLTCLTETCASVFPCVPKLVFQVFLGVLYVVT